MEQQSEQKQIFRQKSIDRVSSPEELNSYLRVASPSMWLILAAVVVFLAGMCIWGIFGHIESSVSCAAIVSNGQCTLYVSSDKVQTCSVGDTVHINGHDYTVASISAEPISISKTFSAYAREIGNLSVGSWAYALTVEGVEEADGVYEASIVEETITPISFLTDKKI